MYNLKYSFNYLAGYDMQFDMKYAYFNFLQSIPYTLSNDPSLKNLRDGEAHFGGSSCKRRDESDVGDVSGDDENE